MVNLGDTFPNFTVETTMGTLDLHEFFKNRWGILFSHPSDFTPVCTTELGAMAKIYPDFEKNNIRVIALSCNPLESHKLWVKDIIAFNDLRMNDLPFPIISDEKRELAVQLGMLDPIDKDNEGIPLTCRAVFIVGPDKKLKLSMLYPATSGRNFPELFRAVASLKLTEEKKVATPANWMPGEACMVIPSVKDEEIPLLFPKGVTSYNVPSGRKYIRVTPQPDP
ncbi:peroxiredoxin-6-like [Dermacentor andersoni]|uniref:peroxiredoxin-6-like n=1 Tax=Dermacentor andersoni TaxID=34620 RepID=UPI002155C5FA|nr:peroxiredoxin-6-like [Dermacentor andersoni]